MLELNKLLFSEIQKSLKITSRKALLLQKLNIKTIRDLLFYRPTHYQTKNIEPNLSKLSPDEYIQALVLISDIEIPTKSHKPLRCLAYNDTGVITLVFFHRSFSLLSKLRSPGKHLISGKVQLYNYNPQIVHPEFIYNSSLYPDVYPIYKLTTNITNSELYGYILAATRLVQNAVYNLDDSKIKDYLQNLLHDLKLIHSIDSPIKRPKERESALKNLAKQELIVNQLILRDLRVKNQRNKGNILKPDHELQKLILNNLGFDLTKDQAQVISEIEQDQQLDVPMMRLLQGDVGSGKTLVALLSMINAVSSGFQSALMAPTELLANQHHNFFQKALNLTGIKVGLLTAKISSKERMNLLSDLEDGNIKILIGTHALFQDKVNFSKLGYVIIDEQHKFGVEQRNNLINKADHPDVLVMTATPIPRSLTLTMFGDMSVSKIIDKPQNRLAITTNIMPNNKLKSLIDSLEKRLIAGEKIYWICSLVEQSNEDILVSTETRFQLISKIYPNAVGMVHGKMKSEQKDAIMQQFKDGSIQILVATSVVEVGIDVPDATVIVIEDAGQFALAQLHQMRGRVGRSHLQSYCILVYNQNSLTNLAIDRFKVLKNSNDGFYIAEQDLILRGSGEILGTKQSGENNFFFADLVNDIDILIEANKLVTKPTYPEYNTALTDFQIKLFDKTYSL